MRGYLPVTVEEIAAFLESQSMECGPLYAPTIKFLTANSEMDEEEGEFLLSMLAADEALEMRANPTSAGFILALEVSDPEITELLNQYQRSGVPLYLLYPRGNGKAQILPQILLQTMVVDALSGVK